MSKDVKFKSPPSPAVLFRGEIEAAVAGGEPVQAMVLRLTLNDGRRLRRDESIPLDHINYAGGEMHFLGVRVVEGGVTISVLDRTGAA